MTIPALSGKKSRLRLQVRAWRLDRGLTIIQGRLDMLQPEHGLGGGFNGYPSDRQYRPGIGQADFDQSGDLKESN